VGGGDNYGSGLAVVWVCLSSHCHAVRLSWLLQVGKGSSFTFDLALADEDCDSESEGDSFSEVDRSAAAWRQYDCTASSSHAAYADFVFSLCFILKQDHLLAPEAGLPYLPAAQLLLLLLLLCPSHAL